MKSIDTRVAAMRDEMIALRRKLHRIPEVGFAEFKTAEVVAGYLKELGLDVKTGVGGTGVVALLKGAHPGLTVGVRACLDGLEVVERTGLDFTSGHEGRMHGCGHDGNMAMVLGAAKILAGMRDEMRGNVKFIFQPSEENTGGAAKVITEGHLENPHVDLILTPHNWPYLAEGVIGLRPGPVMASSDIFRLELIGKAGHGAWPHLAVDPMLMAADVIQAIQRIISREIDPTKAALITLGKISGGTAVNIISEKIVIDGTVRTFYPELRDFIQTRIEEIARGVTQAARGSYRLDYDRVMPPAWNDEQFAAQAAAILKSAESPLPVKGDLIPEMGCEEFALFQEKIPGLFIFIGNDRKDTPIVPIHAPDYDFNENILRPGAKLVCEIVLGSQNGKNL